MTDIARANGGALIFENPRLISQCPFGEPRVSDKSDILHSGARREIWEKMAKVSVRRSAEGPTVANE
jgi:hypothetical protein